jgi:hypothetical protein
MHTVRSVVANEALAAVPDSPSEAPNEEDYRTFYAVLSASGRGRAFLAEHARRHRGADTEAVLAVLARLESLLRSRQANDENLRGELRTVLGTIRAGRSELATSALPARAAGLARLLDMLERRLETLVDDAARPSPAPDAALAVVPPADEPELPIPSPTGAAPVLTLAHNRDPSPTQPRPAAKAAIPEVTWLEPVSSDTAGSAAGAHDGAAAPPTESPAPPPKVFEPLFLGSAEPESDPLAPLLLLSEHGRLALFT